MIHRFKQHGYNVVLDVFSGSIHLVDEPTYDIIGMYEDNSADAITDAITAKYAHDGVTVEDVAECLEDIAELKKEGKLFTVDAFEDIAKNYRRSTYSIKALCLHVAHTCNLNCTYCFAGQGKYKGDRAIMSLDTGKRALDFLIENSGTHVNLDVDFFGGEPLLNWDVVKQLVAYGREQEKIYGKNIRFTLTTNGVLLDDEVTEFCNKEMYNVVLSLDGRKETNDRFRKDYKGVGSYDTIVPRFKEFLKKRGDKEYYMRGTYTHHNVDFLSDILHMADLGFDKLSMEPVVVPPSDPCALTEEDKPVLYRQYEQLAEEMIKRNEEGRGFTFYHYMINLTGGPCIYKRVAGCGSGTEYLAVTPWGELFPCHQFVGDSEYSMGNIWDGVTNTALRDKFAGCNAYSRPECADCWAKLYCSGGCAANAYHATGDISGTYTYGCDLFKKRIECAITVKIAELHREQRTADGDTE